MAISCAHCKGEHQRPEQVRACWAGQGVTDQSVTDRDVTDRDVTDQSVTDERSAGGGLGANSLDPPAVLGRHLILAAEGSGSVPPAWSRAERVQIDRRVLTDLAHAARLLDLLRSACLEGRSVVWEVAGGDWWDSAPETSISEPPEACGPQFSLVLDDLHELMWAQAIDLRDPLRPRWSVIDRCLALGARLPGPGESGDIVASDIGPCWVDPRPLRALEPIGGIPVLSGVSITHGSLLPPSRLTVSADLAPDQLRAVGHPGGAVRVIAPAGSGKTRVLTERARHLITNWNIPASAITVLAFNRRAQEELTERTGDLPQLQIRTLNSVALAIMNGTPPFAARPRTVTTIGEAEVRRVLFDLVGPPRRRNTDPLAPWIEALGLIRLGLRDPADVEETYEGDVAGLREAWPAYRAALERRGWVDFDGQIHGALEILLSDPVARRAAQRACRVLLVDEFQDLTPAHILLIRLLAGPEASVCAVGDDDQTIYGYNGADPAWLIQFSQLFPGAAAHPLEVNYRCPARVVEVVDRLLRHNRHRVPKSIRPAPDRDPRPQGWSTMISADPVADTVGRVRELLTEGAQPEEVVVLGRVNAVLAPVKAAMVDQGLAVSGGVGSEFLDRTAIRAFGSWLRLGRGQFSPEDLLEALRRPSRPLHPRCTTWVSEQTDLAGLRRLSQRLRDERESRRVGDFAADIERLAAALHAGATTEECVGLVADEFGLGASISTVDHTRRGMNRAAQGDDLTALRQLARLQRDPDAWDHWLRRTLGAAPVDRGVLLSTVHRVKGLEWPQVIVHLADTEQFPHRLSEDADEERRIFHVALTRARNHVTIVTGPEPSAFVSELVTEPAPMAAEPQITGPAPAVVQPRRTSAPARDEASLEPVSRRAIDYLRAYRTAAKGPRPAYLVFDDATMFAIATALPESLSELAAIRGIGPAKLELHGDAVLAAIQQALELPLDPDSLGH